MPSGMWTYKHKIDDTVEVVDRLYFGCKNYGISKLNKMEELLQNSNIRKGFKSRTGDS